MIRRSPCGPLHGRTRIPPILTGRNVRPSVPEHPLYFTDRGIEELANRRGEEEVTFEWLAERLREFVDLNPEFEIPVERLATWLARLDDDEDE
ncbi:DUF6104 family protein [Actinacidiphila glaucinigra]|uniref:DUF6104 family protein n=1 Tax=Actinacidiphila glaucinigra TaxID=235986 RepID=UPI0038634EFE